ncbi:hypothetical protein BDY19DRAFT_998784 [Irpex rosettiformis]|uniref:Uncharacterized protein n=1 Tax=Irpex rosettiformis TaxID=378272 RepID=A0ACB8TME9_9APHY|nr:hypothetical protein BDY19DRAFT_998784 [Irpex rosettiformis]
MPLPTVYPVIVPDNSPVLRGLVPCTAIQIESRPSQLPVIYEWIGPHPSHPVKFEGSRTYVYLVDPSPEGKRVAEALWIAQKVPDGHISSISGHVHITPGDTLLARPIDKGGDPAHDCLQGLAGVSLERELTPNMRQLENLGMYKHQQIVALIDEYDAARLDLIGSREFRVDNGGKAWFEVQDRAEPVRGGPWCYGFNSMVQRPRRVEGPPAALRTVDNTPDEYQLNVNRYNKASTALNVAAWVMQGPRKLVKDTQDFGDQVNSPRLGCSENFFWSSQQNNMANAVHLKDVAKFKDAQGFFSGMHQDEGDAGNGHSAALGGSDLPPYAEPGRFHLVGQGVYFTLDYRAQIFFTGLLPHRGTPPLIPPEYKIEGWEIRMLLISYPASDILSGEARAPLTHLPYEDFPLHITPEMTGAFATTRDNKPFWTPRTSYSLDGWVCTDSRAHINYLVRSHVQLLYWILAQVPAHYGVEINADLMTDAVTFLENNIRTTADRWKFAPNPDVNKRFGDTHRAVQDAFLKDTFDHLMQGIPSLTSNRYKDWDCADTNFGSRPKAATGTKRPRAQFEAANS